MNDNVLFWLARIVIEAIPTLLVCALIALAAVPLVLWHTISERLKQLRRRNKNDRSMQ